MWSLCDTSATIEIEILLHLVNIAHTTVITATSGSDRSTTIRRSVSWNREGGRAHTMYYARYNKAHDRTTMPECSMLDWQRLRRAMRLST